MPRFVLLRHKCPPDFEKSSHWDLMLEAAGILRTWELSQLPSAWTADSAGEIAEVPANALPDHRLDYLEYEGQISRNRGEVRRIDTGRYEIISQSAEELKIEMKGQRCRGEVILSRHSEPIWLLRVC